MKLIFFKSFKVTQSLFNNVNKNKKPKFDLILLLGLFAISITAFTNIPLFKLLLCSYILYCCLFYLRKTNYISDKFFNSFFSGRNVIIRLFMITVTFIFFGCFILLPLAKLAGVLLINLLFKEKLTVMNIFTLSIVCLISGSSHLLLSSALIELYTFKMMPWSNIFTNPNNSQGHLPAIFNQSEQQQEFRNHQIALQEMLKANGDTNYKDSVPLDLTDYNIAKANNAYEKVEQESKSISGQADISKKASDLLSKMREQGNANNEFSIHNKFSYDELAMFKFFGKNYPVKLFPGYNGIIREGPFADSSPNNIEIKHSIVPGKSEFGNHFEAQVEKYKSNLKNELKRTNNQT